MSLFRLNSGSIVVLLLVLLVFVPLFYLAYEAIVNFDLVWPLVWQLKTLNLILNTLLLVVATTVSALVLGFLLAWVTTRIQLPQKTLLTALLAMPLAIPSFILSMTLIEAYGPSSFIEDLLKSVFGAGFSVPVFGFFGSLFALTSLTFPYVFISVRSAMLRLDYQLESVSRATGYGRIKTFRVAILPYLIPSLAYSGLLVALYTLSEFGALALLRYDTFTTIIYRKLSTGFDEAIGLSFVLSLFAIVFAVLVPLVFITKNKLYRVSPATSQRLKTSTSKYLKIVALAFCLIVILTTFVVPLVVVLYWLFLSFDLEELRGIFEPLFNTVLIALLATSLTVVASYFVAKLVVKNNSFWSGLINAFFQIGYGIPSVAIALAVLLFTLNFAPFTYPLVSRSILGMSTVYVVIFMPIAIGTLTSALRQVEPRFEDAAQILGYPKRRIFWAIKIPLIWQGILAATLLVSILVAKELPVALLLSPIGTKTLSTTIWSAASEGFFSKTGLVSFILILVGLPSVYLIVRQSKQRFITDEH